MKSMLLATTMLVALTTFASADPLALTSVPFVSSEDILAPGLQEVPVAEGIYRLENPSKWLGYYGYGLDGPISPAKGAKPEKDKPPIEATKTEPDKNTYLVLTGQSGPAKGYNYGTHFLFQGHEAGPADDKDKDVQHGGLTRINLDANLRHRVTLMVDTDNNGKPLPPIDGSVWDPFAKVLLLTAEDDTNGGVWQATVDFPSKATDLTGVFGKAAYEGVQVDLDGTIWLVEDASGKTGSTNKSAKQPNSFLYRFIPKIRDDISKGGKLQVLQVLDQYAKPIAFHDGKADDDIKAPVQAILYGYNYELSTRWVTIHDTDKDGIAAFDANAAAKAAMGTPFKRPENGQFRPGIGYKEFYFSVTGDTNIKTEAGEIYGGFGGIMRLTQKKPSSDTGRISIVWRGDAAHSGFDNVSFYDANDLLVAEDAGDKLHAQRNALDSLYMIDVTADYTSKDPIRVLAQGRDAAATLDTTFSGMDGYQNEGDNEITGIHVSNGDPTVAGLIGTAVPTPFVNGWRVFYTHQHGTNTTYEILPAK